MEFETIDIIIALLIGGALAGLGFIFINNPIVNNIQSAHSDIDYLINGTDIIIKNISVHEQIGFSMRPTIFTGNKVIVVTYTNQNLKDGEIIVFENEENISVLHRIKGIYPDYLYTQGDNNNAHEKINYSQIKYIVVGVLFE